MHHHHHHHHYSNAQHHFHNSSTTYQDMSIEARAKVAPAAIVVSIFVTAICVAFVGMTILLFLNGLMGSPFFLIPMLLVPVLIIAISLIRIINNVKLLKNKGNYIEDKTEKDSMEDEDFYSEE